MQEPVGNARRRGPDRVQGSLDVDPSVAVSVRGEQTKVRGRRRFRWWDYAHRGRFGVGHVAGESDYLPSIVSATL